MDLYLKTGWFIKQNQHSSSLPHNIPSSRFFFERDERSHLSTPVDFKSSKNVVFFGVVIILKITLFRVALEGCKPTEVAGSPLELNVLTDFCVQIIQVSNKSKWISDISMEILFCSQKDALKKKNHQKI